MKIAMMTPWNTSCGVAMHAELIGREWIRMGHELNVLAPISKKRLSLSPTRMSRMSLAATLWIVSSSKGC